MTDSDHCTLCRQRAGLPVAPVEIAHDDPRPCEGDCKHCAAVGRVAQLEHSLAAVQADAGRVLEERREAQADNARLREYIERVNVELHERRAADLTAEERDALRNLRTHVVATFVACHAKGVTLDVLDRLLERKP